MTELIVIRHAEPDAAFNESTDPGLSENGHGQAATVAAELKTISRRPVFSSPLRRATETAQPIADALDVSVAVAPVLTEVPTPGFALPERAEFVQALMKGRWSEQNDTVNAWRDAIVEAATDVQFPQIWVAHFVVINALASFVQGSDHAVVCLPGHCAQAVFDVVDGEVSVRSLPAKERTTIR